MRLFLGVDGGQSGTTALIGDEAGRVLGAGSGGPCNHAEAAEGRQKLLRAVGGSVAAGGPTPPRPRGGCPRARAHKKSRSRRARRALRGRLLRYERRSGRQASYLTADPAGRCGSGDRKSTRLNSSHLV